jgi:hypothetical protein
MQEIIRGQGHSSAVDWWALGMVQTRTQDWNLIFFLGAFLEFQVTFLARKLD